MAKPTGTGSRRSRLRLAAVLAAVAVGIVGALAGGAFADNLTSDAGTSTGVTTITAGNSTTITYHLVGNNSPGTDPSGCDASTAHPVTVTITRPPNVNGSPASLSFTGCGPTDGKTATFTSNTPGTYDITHSIAGGVSGSQFRDNADFTLTVNAATPTNTAPTLNLPSDITVEATSGSGAAVTYTATANDTEDGALTPSCSPASGSTFVLGITQVNCSVTDSGGLETDGHFNVTVVDTTAPTLDLPSDITAEATSPSGAVVTFSPSATDAVDGTDSVSCSPDSGSTFALGTTQVNCSATDTHSNTAQGSFNVTVQDTTAPGSGSITINNGDAWTNNTTVTLDLSATDAVGVTGYRLAETAVGLDSASTVSVASATSFSASSVAFSLGSGDAASKTVYVRFYDAAGNPSDASDTIGLDSVKPKITGETNGYTPGTWTNQSVTVSFTCADDQGSANSGIDTNAVAGDTLTNSGADQSVTNTGTCTDRAGNTADAVTVSNIDIDKIAPTVNCGSADGNWHASDVSIACTASDNTGGSGLADSSDASFNLSTSVAAGTETSNASTGTHDVFDAAGNKTTAGPISGNMIDKKAPVISCGTTPTFTLGQSSALVTGTATDGGSGPASQNVSTSADTSHVGSYSTTLTASDNVSNQSTKSCPYTVAYGWSGFLQPINDTAHFVGETTSVFKAGSTVPVKFQLTDASGASVQEAAPGPVWLTPQQGGNLPSTITVDETTYSDSSTPGGYYRWDSTGLQYIYNWNTSKSMGGKYWRIGVKLDDGNTYYVSIGLK